MHLIFLNDNTYDCLRKDSERQKMNIEEFCAIAFVAWITAPEYLVDKQPVLFRSFEEI